MSELQLLAMIQRKAADITAATMDLKHLSNVSIHRISLDNKHICYTSGFLLADR